ncbi:MAG: substrate-binding domain-containing protein [Flavobacteriaceae bacterium]|jgi:phosphate transport system substrate-binding protein|nr:substrate-binding domain-containing protein [Flavobacteriaceae bacterium]
MNISRKIQVALLSVLLIGGVVGCKKSTEKVEIQEEIPVEDTPVAGHIEMLVEESIFPIVEDVANVFKYEYSRTKIDLKIKSEQEILELLFRDSIRVAVLPREFSEKELKFFEGKVTPKITHFATDAIVFVANKAYKDSILDLDKVISNLKKKDVDVQKEGFLVFDNYTSNVSSTFRKIVGEKEFAKEYAYYLGTTNEVINYVNSNPNAIGVIGLNWLSQSDKAIEAIKSDLKVLAVKNTNDGKFYKPSQNNIAEGTYPLTRKLCVIDLQGKSGLGVGFASYIAGYKGQRIVLKSGLVPFKVPPREIQVRKEL